MTTPRPRRMKMRRRTRSWRRRVRSYCRRRDQRTGRERSGQRRSIWGLNGFWVEGTGVLALKSGRQIRRDRDMGMMRGMDPWRRRADGGKVTGRM